MRRLKACGNPFKQKDLLKQDCQELKNKAKEWIASFISFTRNDSKCAFTLAETLITLVIIGVVAALTIPNMIAKYQEEQTVAKVKKTYSIISQAWNKFQIDNSCLGKVSKCFDVNDSHGNQGPFQQKFIKYFNYTKYIPTGSNISKVNWLPEKAYHMDGTLITQYWMGIHKYTSTSASSYIALTDGTIIHIQMPDNYKESGFIFIDTNGAKKPNRIGKDQFPIGIGAYNNPTYAAKVNPYYNEDGDVNNGLCNIRNNGVCDPDVCTKESCSPTAYVLKNNKLPHINW